MSPELLSWLQLQQTSGVGPGTARRLLQHFGTPQQIFSASLAELSSLVSARVARALLTPPSPEFLQLAERTQRWCEAEDQHCLHQQDAAYPAQLLQIPDPPLLLYVKGHLALLEGPGIGVVGSRNATQQGVRDAAAFAASLSRAGITVVSGLAAGIDAAAHQGALDGPGSTVAVIGTGIDIVYPARHRDLAHLIAGKGCLVSEYPLGTPAIASNFPRRNRIISGLSLGVLVVEAAAQSGSLITARTALEQGREVFAIPGSIHSPLSKGCHALIRQGAKLVETAEDILEELAVPLSLSVTQEASQVPEGPASEQDDLLALIGYDPVHTDWLIGQYEGDTAAVMARLTELELMGLVENLPGNLYRRLAA